MAERKPLFFNDTDGFNEEMATGDTATFGGLSLGGDLTFTAGEVKGLPDTPTDPNAAASKKYVDAVASGLDPKESVRVATTADLASYVAAGSGVGKTLTAPDNGSSHNTIDGVLLAVGNRVLVKNQGGGASSVDNGIYTVTQLGDDATTPFKLTRATDFDEDAEVTNGAHCFVGEGTVNAAAAWVLTTADPVTVDTTAMAFTQYAGPGTYTGGNGIDITGTTISVDLATGTGPGLEFGSGGDAGKLLVKLESDGALRFDPSNKGLEVELEASNPTLQVSTNALGVKYDSNKGLTTGALGMEVKVDGSTVTFDGSGNLQAAADKAGRVENDFNVDEAIAVADPVYWTSTGDRIGKALANTISKSFPFAVAKTAQATVGNPSTVVSHGTCAGILSGATPGTRYWLQNTGGMATTRPTGSGARLVMMGMAKSGTDFWVDIRDFSRRA